jgi:hypothetical protein
MISTTSSIPQPPALDNLFSKTNALPPRLQWEGNGGYCGETSMIVAGLYYGQYLSQYDVRAIASPGIAQNHQDADGFFTAQLLLGKNDVATAERLHLQYDQCISPSSSDFLGWVRAHVAMGHPVIIGVLNNVFMLGEQGPGDPEYDHIVPVIGFGSNQKLDDPGFFPGDEILFSDNGLFTPPGPIPYYYATALKSFLAGREQANKHPDGNLYSLLELPEYQSDDGKKRNYGIAITGVKDELNETLPVRVTTDHNYESPSIGDSSNIKPGPEPITLTITVSELVPGETYNLYYYQRRKDVPHKNFNAAGIKPWKIITADSAQLFTTEMQIQSGETAFFRAVKA